MTKQSKERMDNMKQIDKTTFFWSGLTAMNSLFILVFLWSVIPFGGETLPRVMEQLWTIPFSSSAILVSLLCALLAAGIILLTALHPAVVPAAEVEQRVKRCRTGRSDHDLLLVKIGKRMMTQEMRIIEKN